MGHRVCSEQSQCHLRTTFTNAGGSWLVWFVRNVKLNTNCSCAAGSLCESGNLCGSCPTKILTAMIIHGRKVFFFLPGIAVEWLLLIKVAVVIDHSVLTQTTWTIIVVTDTQTTTLCCVSPCACIVDGYSRARKQSSAHWTRTNQMGEMTGMVAILPVHATQLLSLFFWTIHGQHACRFSTQNGMFRIELSNNRCFTQYILLHWQLHFAMLSFINTTPLR